MDPSNRHFHVDDDARVGEGRPKSRGPRTSNESHINEPNSVGQAHAYLKHEEVLSSFLDRRDLTTSRELVDNGKASLDSRSIFLGQSGQDSLRIAQSPEPDHRQSLPSVVVEPPNSPDTRFRGKSVTSIDIQNAFEAIQDPFVRYQRGVEFAGLGLGTGEPSHLASPPMVGFVEQSMGRGGDVSQTNDPRRRSRSAPNPSQLSGESDLPNRIVSGTHASTADKVKRVKSYP